LVLFRKKIAMSRLYQPVRVRLWSRTGVTHAALAVIVAIVVLGARIGRASDRASSVNSPNTSKPAAPPALMPEELYARVAPSVVTIVAKDENHETSATGSGFFVDEALFIDRCDRRESDTRYAEHLRNDKNLRGAFVLTNYHVIRPAVSAEIELSNGDKGTVWHVLAEDERRDLALVSVTVPATHPLKGVALAADDPPVMTTVCAIGSPQGLRGTASEGRVSSYQELFAGQRWLQTTAPISPGSSGGPLLSPDGKLVGVTTLSYAEGQNLNFAIPVSVVRSFLATGQYSRRDIAEGASLRWHEQKAFDEVRSALWSGKRTSAEKHALQQLLNVRVEIENAIAEPPTTDVDQAIAWARVVEDSLPKEFEYLRHYLIGKASLSAATRSVPKDASAIAGWTQEAAIRYRTSDHAANARYHLLEARKLQPDFSPAHRSVYDHHRASSNTPDALLTSDTLVRLMPRSAEALSLRAECYSDLNQPASAKTDLAAAIDLSPHDGKLHYELANVLCKLGDYDDAIKTYQTALACNRQDLRGALHYRLGLAYQKSGNPEKALTEFRTAKALGWPTEQCNAQIAVCQTRDVVQLASFEPHHQLPRASSRSLDELRAIVYVTTTGKKYHCDGCHHLKTSKRPIPLNQAAKTYEPCAHCRPLTLNAIESSAADISIGQNSVKRDRSKP
jgi:S1-C subfamily serine protease/tetratricopeptide (TPR) repeat protein